MSQTVLGKRKSRLQKANPTVSHEEAQAIFARHFETKFMPLASTADMPETEDPEADSHQSDDVDQDDHDEGDDDSWGGFSGDEVDDETSSEPSGVEVVSHTEAYTTTSQDKRESRAWLSSRPPTAATEVSSSSTTSKSKKTATAADEDAPSLLKNDLALQRLLSESHLFSSAAANKNGADGDGTTSSSTTEHEGRNRHLATDLRLAALGSKTSIYKQAKMPMSFRKGIAAAAVGRETKRRREAKENGIVLERPARAAALDRIRPGAAARRKSGGGGGGAIDAPAVGRMSNGMLKLSKRDIASIEGGGPRKGAAGFTKKKRRR